MSAPRRRATRSQTGTPAPLPAVQSKQSHAYGSQGKTTLYTQLATEDTSLEAIMAPAALRVPSQGASTNNGRSPSRRHPGSTRSRVPSTVPEEPKPQSPSPQPALPVLHPPEPDLTLSDGDGDVDDAERDRTRLSEQRVYARGLAEVRDRRQRERDRQQEDARRRAMIAQAQPSRLRIFVSALPRYIPLLIRDANGGKLSRAFELLIKTVASLLLAVTALGVIFAIARSSSVPKFMAPYATNVINAGKTLTGQSLYDKPPTELEERWLRFKHDLELEPMLPKDVLDDKQYQVNLLLGFRIEKLEKRVAAAEDALGLHAETLEMLNRVLPSHIVVEEEHGEVVLGEHFWHAFQQKMGTDAAAPLWDAFLERNEQAVAAIGEKAAVREMNGRFRSQSIISAADLTREMDKQYMRLKTENADDLNRAEKTVLKEARIAAQAMIEGSPLNKISKLQTAAFTSHLTVENGLREIHSVNFLSRSLGAVANERLSSPSARAPYKGIIHSSYTWWRGLDPFPNDQNVALDRWADVGDAWCAAASGGMGVAQLAIDMEHTIYPETFTVEHMPRSGTLHISAAPKDFDVWAEARNAAEAQQLEAAIQVPRGAACGSSPGPTFVCIGAGMYDIHAANWVQEIPLFARTHDVDMPVSRVIFKVLNNWGGNYTCLYRVRMTGVRLP